MMQLVPDLQKRISHELDIDSFARMMAVSRHHKTLLSHREFAQRHQEMLQKMVDSAGTPRGIATALTMPNSRAFLQYASHLPVPKGAVFCSFIPRAVRDAYPTLACLGPDYLGNVHINLLSDAADVHGEMQRWRNVASHGQPNSDAFRTHLNRCLDSFFSECFPALELTTMRTWLPSESTTLPYSVKEFVGIANVLIDKHIQYNPSDGAALHDNFADVLTECMRLGVPKTIDVARLMRCLFLDRIDTFPKLPQAAAPKRNARVHVIFPERPQAAAPKRTIRVHVIKPLEEKPRT